MENIMKKWTTSNIPSQSGRTAIVTGANSGLGLETARALANKGAHVILACRSEERGKQALDKIKYDKPQGSVELALLDLSSLESVIKFTQSFKTQYNTLDLLINNAGVMTPPASKTVDGFELQIGVNYLGHFALTAGLFDLLKQGNDPRVITLSSLAHRWGKIELNSFSDISNYNSWREYGQSKIACLMFAIELDERLREAGISMKSSSAHPGGTKTDLQRHNLMSRVLDFMYMEASQGALPSLYCATELSSVSGSYIGPGACPAIKIFAIGLNCKTGLGPRGRCSLQILQAPTSRSNDE
jgi:NAD(P)-dependent dehydrogenase (short-subunit alcohol dehydrogenase family)